MPFTMAFSVEAAMSSHVMPPQTSPVYVAGFARAKLPQIKRDDTSRCASGANALHEPGASAVTRDKLVTISDNFHYYDFNLPWTCNKMQSIEFRRHDWRCPSFSCHFKCDKRSASEWS